MDLFLIVAYIFAIAQKVPEMFWLISLPIRGTKIGKPLFVKAKFNWLKIFYLIRNL